MNPLVLTVFGYAVPGCSKKVDKDRKSLMENIEVKLALQKKEKKRKQGHHSSQQYSSQR